MTETDKLVFNQNVLISYCKGRISHYCTRLSEVDRDSVEYSVLLGRISTLISVYDFLIDDY